METGHLHWTNAGHPPPLHIRDGKVISQLRCEPTLPWGLETGATGPAVALEVLAPGDRLLFYTDGVVESKKTSPESAFGLERLADLGGQTASSQLSLGQS
jgi:serine phosphatase RsbU (regulator of sigma subunit)